ncbi:D-ribose pyranase [Roseibium porphyridii]|uniref:D-ribose pyranase n=1 Tax=Roseibium porphyridii TaxID=2866279 RepID=A0ABY8F4S9_9HYPH|nr:D-ribose pyranase [Roseibium sp. KMA01]WFE90507.1 D-ribose pyranase [Roseibium sp. KMA01]
MKRTALLNRHLSELVASLGHLDAIIVADAGLPVPQGVRVIDLAVSEGVPGFQDLLKALRAELVIESAIWAEETSDEMSALMQEEIDQWSLETEQNVTTSRVSHAELKRKSGQVRAIIRTGEFTPYANILLISGVPF